MSIVDLSEVLLELGIADSPTVEEKAIATLAISKAEKLVKNFLGYDPVYSQRMEFYCFGGISEDKINWEVNTVFISNRNAGNVLQLRRLPVRGYPSIDLRIDLIGGVFGENCILEEGKSWVVDYNGVDSKGRRFSDSGILYYLRGNWPTFPYGIGVSYYGGYKPEELRGRLDSGLDGTSIWSACLMESVRLAKLVLSKKKNEILGHISGVVNSERLGDYSYSLSAEGEKQLFGDVVFSLSNEAKGMLSPYVNMGYLLGGF